MTLTTIDQFLASTERRALRMALLATHNNADALDIVQESMTKLFKHYRQKPAEEWPRIFQRILQNCITDWHRQQQRNSLLFWRNKKQGTDDEEDDVSLEDIASLEKNTPSDMLTRMNNVEVLLAAIETLPLRQQQAFLLRAWEGFSINDCADIMNCSTGSIKTHYFRALKALRICLEPHYETA